MSLSDARRKRLKEAIGRAPPNPNACIRCFNMLLAAISAAEWSKIPICQHFQERDRVLQSRKAITDGSSADDEDAADCLRCLVCTTSGQHCHQVCFTRLPQPVPLQANLGLSAGPRGDRGQTDSIL